MQGLYSKYLLISAHLRLNNYLKKNKLKIYFLKQSRLKPMIMIYMVELHYEYISKYFSFGNISRQDLLAFL